MFQGATIRAGGRIDLLSVVPGTSRMYPIIPFVLQSLVVIFSMAAGLFWMSSATGHKVGAGLDWPPWKPTSLVVPPSERAAHQAKWNTRAAFCASIAAIAQALFFLYEHPLPSQ